jgi:hypothetical protein
MGSFNLKIGLQAFRVASSPGQCSNRVRVSAVFSWKTSGF